MHKESVKRQKIKAVILAGSRDFGRCPLASRLHTALWPVAGKPVLERLLQHVSHQGIKQAVICYNGDSSLLTELIRGSLDWMRKALRDCLTRWRAIKD